MPFKMQPNSVIKARLGIQHGGELHKFFTNACYKAMDEFVPKSAGTDGGNLRETVDVQADKIIYEMPYASYQYYGIRQDGTHKVVNYTTPGTGPYWDKVMWTAKGPSIVKQVQKKMNGGN